MKQIFLTLVITLIAFGFFDSFYGLSFARLDGTVVALSSLKGKRVILVPIDGGAPDWRLLHALDSAQKVQPDSLAVIAFPALDFDSLIDVGSLGRIHDSLGLSLTIAAPVYVSKTAGQAQLPLFQWLTSMARNSHFDRDVVAVGQLYIVSGKGTLYSVIDEASYAKVLAKVISSKVWGD